MRAFAHSAAVTARLLREGCLASPRRLIGHRLRFADGTTSLVFRETAIRGGDTRNPAVLVVQFRLWLLDDSRVLHAFFRHECIAHTPLFAGFPGFRSKLWLTDVGTWVYRGVYEWDGSDQAEAYATTLSGLLRPFSYRDTVRHHLVPDIRRDDFIRHPDLAMVDTDTATSPWWRLRDPIEPAPQPP